MISQPQRLVLFDGVCGLCNRMVDFCVRVDRRRIFRYAPLQGETARSLRVTHPEIPDDLDTIVFIDEGKVYFRSQAILRAAKYLGLPWSIAGAFRWLPAFVGDSIYNFIARRRYRMFGKAEVCRLPLPHERELFLP